MTEVLPLLLAYKYWILLSLAMLEGPVVAFVAGYLTHLGIFALWAVAFIILLSELLPDALFYYLGYYGKSTKLAHAYLRHPASTLNLKKLEHLWFTHGMKVMLLGKLSYGLGGPILATAGVARLPLGTYMRYALPITIAKYSIIVALGYFVGLSSQAATHYLELALTLVGALAAFVAISYILLTRYSEQKLRELEGGEDADPTSSA